MFYGEFIGKNTEMKKLFFIFFLFFFTLSNASFAQNSQKGITSITLEGGPIATKHFQSDDENFRERHGLGIIKVHTKGYGNWGLYFLSPNSVDDTSVGAGYVTNPYVIPLGPTELELSGALGLVTGYQDYPVPMLAGQVRLKIYESGPWNAGISSAVLPYIIEDDTGDNDFGVVATTPFLSLRYKF